MKAMHKQLWGYLLITLSLAGFTPLQAQTDSADEGGYITLSGIVKDKKSKKSLEYVNISIPGSTTGTVTNADGEFSFKVKDSIHAKEVEISHLGYFNSKIELNGKDVEEQTVWLTPYTNMLDEVIIHARDPRYLVEEAIKKIPANYSSKHSLLTGFYRETAQKGRRYINISEAVIDIYKTPYDEGVDRDRVQIFKGRKLLSQKASDTLAVKLLGGPNLSVYVDVVKNPDVLLDITVCALLWKTIHRQGTALFHAGRILSRHERPQQGHAGDPPEKAVRVTVQTGRSLVPGQLQGTQWADLSELHP